MKQDVFNKQVEKVNIISNKIICGILFIVSLFFLVFSFYQDAMPFGKQITYLLLAIYFLLLAKEVEKFF
jgi:membrane-bound ClpP family serine protease